MDTESIGIFIIVMIIILGAYAPFFITSIVNAQYNKECTKIQSANVQTFINKINDKFLSDFKTLKATEDALERIKNNLLEQYAFQAKLLSYNNVELSHELFVECLQFNIENTPEHYNLDIKIEDLKFNADGVIIVEQLIPNDWKIFIKDSVDKFIKEGRI
jgi:hypothetical protein